MSMRSFYENKLSEQSAQIEHLSVYGIFFYIVLALLVISLAAIVVLARKLTLLRKQLNGLHHHDHNHLQQPLLEDI